MVEEAASVGRVEDVVAVAHVVVVEEEAASAVVSVSLTEVLMHTMSRRREERGENTFFFYRSVLDAVPLYNVNLKQTVTRDASRKASSIDILYFVKTLIYSTRFDCIVYERVMSKHRADLFFIMTIET